MKKYILAAVIQISALTSYAGEPVNLSCAVDQAPHSEYLNLKTILVADVLSENPESNFVDSGLMDPPVSGNSRIELSFSNECDNIYTLQISEIDALVARKTGQVHTIVHLEYMNTNVPEDIYDMDKLLTVDLQCDLISN